MSAESSLLKTESSEVAQNVTLSQLNDLPILAIGSTNEGFRDPWAAVKSGPGNPLCRRLQYWRRRRGLLHLHEHQRSAF